MKSFIEISGAALAGNFRAVQAVAGEGTEVLAVIKANAYGHGATVCAPLLVQAGARWLGVSDVEEGIVVRKALGEQDAHVVVMCGMQPGDAAAMVLHDLTPVVWTAEHIAALEQAARRIGSRCAVHVEVDTGMARQGVAPGPELQALLELLAGSKWLDCEGLMTHLCCSEAAGSAMTALQQQRFTVALQQALAAGVHPELVHMANTSAVDEGGMMRWLSQAAGAVGARPMVRTGLALYGLCLPLEGDGASAPALLPKLQPVLCWKTSVIGVRDIPAGATVGYSATFTAAVPMRLALLPVGYADGFRRAASSGMGNGWVMIAGQRAPVVGRVSMNLTTVDVTAINGVAEGAEVVLLGEGVSAEDHAGWSGTIAYDVLCGIRAHFVEI